MHVFNFSDDAGLVAQAWISHLQSERRMATKTLDAYARDLRQFGAFLEQHIGERATVALLSGLKTADFRSFMSQRRQDGAESRSLARQLSALRSFYKFAERNGDFSNPALAALRSPRLPHRLPRPLSEDAAKAAVACGAGEEIPDWIAARDSAILLLLYACGLRISEALSLTPRLVARDPLVIMGKGGKTRIVPLLVEAREAVERYISMCPLALKLDEPVFRGLKGGVLSARVVQLHVARLRGALGLSDTATPHALRHSFASHMLGAGADLRVIQELLGHASLSTTQAYTEVNRAHIMQQYKKAFGGSS
jgi:integrase/recombinase XerC